VFDGNVKLPLYARISIASLPALSMILTVEVVAAPVTDKVPSGATDNHVPGITTPATLFVAGRTVAVAVNNPKNVLLTLANATRMLSPSPELGDEPKLIKFVAVVH